MCTAMHNVHNVQNAQPEHCTPCQLATLCSAQCVQQCTMCTMCKMPSPSTAPPANWPPCAVHNVYSNARCAQCAKCPARALHPLPTGHLVQCTMYTAMHDVHNVQNAQPEHCTPCQLATLCS